jgi:outer membrane protein TolC
LSLHDALRAALADSRVVRILDGGVNVASITPADVEIAAQQILAQQGRFDPRLTANYDASNIDQPPNAFFGPGISASTRRDAVNAALRIQQPLETGGSISLGFEPPTAYLYLPRGADPGQFNPNYSTDVVLRVRQPLLEGAGRTITLAPVQIAQTRRNQTRWELEEALNAQVRSVIEAYWRLYAAHLELQAIRQVIPLADESVRVESLRLAAERSIAADVARAQVQADGFRREEARQQAEVRRRALQLRQLMGGPPCIEPVLVPSDRPQELPPPESVEPLIQTAHAQRPSLLARRERLQERRLELCLAENDVLPSVELRGDYWMNGLAERFDDAFQQTATSDYTDWSLGVGVELPIGNRTALSRRRAAEWNIARDQALLAAAEQQVAFEVTGLFSDVHADWQQLMIAQRQMAAASEWLRVSRIRYTQPPAANTSADWLLLALTDLQSAMRAHIETVSELAAAIADYNTRLAGLDQAQGLAVYQWQNAVQDAVTESLRAGHAGPAESAWDDYRRNPSLAPRPEVIAAGHSTLPRLSHDGPDTSWIDAPAAD